MVKLFKNVLGTVIGETPSKLLSIELHTFVSGAVRIVNDRPLTSVSSHPNDLLPISPSSFIGQQLAQNTPISAFHDRGDLRRDYLYNVTHANKFWKSWFKGYLPTLQGRGKWRVVCQNLAEDQLVLVGNAEDTNKRGAYRLIRVHCAHPQLRRGKEIVRGATITVLKNSGSKKIENVLSVVFKIVSL